MSTLEKAIVIAAETHAGQVDKAGAPYILHPLILMLQMENTEDRIVAVLHDVVEDTDWTLERLRKEGFPLVVIDAIDSEGRENFKTKRRVRSVGSIVSTKKIELEIESLEVLKQALIRVKSGREKAFVQLTAIPEVYLPELVEYLQVLNGLRQYDG